MGLKLACGRDHVLTKWFVGTLLSIHQDPTLYGMELKERLNTESVMRSMADASMLFHGFLDLSKSLRLLMFWDDLADLCP